MKPKEMYCCNIKNNFISGDRDEHNTQQMMYATDMKNKDYNAKC